MQCNGQQAQVGFSTVCNGQDELLFSRGGTMDMRNRERALGPEYETRGEMEGEPTALPQAEAKCTECRGVSTGERCPHF